ncbi:hypothetical protein SNL152K_1195 [Streptomyces sp. NL15-2K]|nr:hypothetical protein SNL152K_1195 [Streptomyces sp. NL15-2K]
MMTSSAPEDVDVVLPCLNEAEALPWVLDRIPPGWRALVVDNGSTDGSATGSSGLLDRPRQSRNSCTPGGPTRSPIRIPPYPRTRSSY